MQSTYIIHWPIDSMTKKQPKELHCDKCFETFMNKIFQANKKAGVKSEEDYLKGEYGQ